MSNSLANWLTLSGGTKVISSDRSSDDILRSIRQNTVQGKLIYNPYAREESVISHIEGNKFTLHYMSPRELLGIVEANDKGCRIKYELRLPRYVLIGFMIWFFVGVLVFILGVCGNIYSVVSMTSTSVWDMLMVDNYFEPGGQFNLTC